MKRVLVLAFLLGLVAHVEVSASSLFGKVIEVNSGDVITILNLNRRVRVRLLGIDAPELNQPFGDVAKQHLSDLVYDQSVIVEYSGIAADRSLTGRVLLNNADIGAQMIRDGAAWVDPSNQERLSITDRDVYQQSEQAARGERRGLWQAEKPLAPWDFVKAEAFKRDPVAQLNAISPKARSNRPVPELNNLTLMTTRQANGSPRAGEPMVRWHRTNGSSWKRLSPAGEKFSALVPADGEQTVIPDDQDLSKDIPVYFGQDGMSRYAISWMRMTTAGESDAVALTGILKNVLAGFGQVYQEVGARRGMNVGFNCEPEDEKNISMNGFTGSEFDLSSCTVPARARVFTRLVGKQREAYLAIAFYMEEDPNVTRFMNSFVINKQNGAK